MQVQIDSHITIIKKKKKKRSNSTLNLDKNDIPNKIPQVVKIYAELTSTS